MVDCLFTNEAVVGFSPIAVNKRLFNQIMPAMTYFCLKFNIYVKKSHMSSEILRKVYIRRNKNKEILLKHGAYILLVCFLKVIKRIAVHYDFLIIDDKNLPLLLYI